MKNVFKPRYLFILLLFFSSRICYSQASSMDQEYDKLIRFVVKTINGDELRDRVFTHPPILMMFCFHLTKEKKIDSITVHSTDSVITSILKKMNYSQLLISWEFLIPASEIKLVADKETVFILPIFIINDLNRSNRMLLSEKDIRPLVLIEKSI